MEMLVNFEGAICEIKSHKNALLCIGTIKSVKGDTIEISGYHNDMLCVIPIDSVIKISARQGSSFCVIEGNVYISGQTRLVLRNIKSINDTERRSFFRVPVENMICKLYRVKDGVRDTKGIEISIKNMSLSGLLFVDTERRSFFRVPVENMICKLYRVKDGVRDTKGIEISIKNMSLSGLLFVPVNQNVTFKNDEKLSIDINLDGTVISVDIVTKRIESDPPSKNISYGCILPSTSERKKDILCNYIFTKERELLRANRRA